MLARLLKHLLLLLFILPFSLYAQLTPCGETQFKLCDSEGAEVTTEAYDTIISFDHNDMTMDRVVQGACFIAYKGKKEYVTKKSPGYWGYDDNEQMVFTQTVMPAALLRNGKFDVLDQKGKLVAGGFERVKVSIPFGEAEGGILLHDLSDTVIIDELSTYVIGLGHPVIARKNGLWGAIDMQGKEVLPFQFQSIAYRYHIDTLLLEAKQNGTTGLYSLSGRAVFAQKYDHISEPMFPQSYNWEDPAFAKKGILFVKHKGKTGIADYYGKEIVPPVYDIVLMESDDVYIVNNGGKFVSSTRVDTFPEVYDGEGSLIMTITDSTIEGGKFGVIDLNNKMIIPVKYDFIEVVAFEHIRFFECVTGGTRTTNTFVNADGPSAYSYYTYTSTSRRLNGKREMYDATGKRLFEGYDNAYGFAQSIAIPGELDLVQYRTEILFVTKKKGKHGLHSDKQEKIISNKYDSIGVIQSADASTYMLILEKNKKFGMADAKGKTLLPLKYDNIFQYGDLIVYNKGGKRTYIVEERYDDWGTGETYKDSAVLIYGGKYGFIDWSGKVMPGEYDSIPSLSQMSAATDYYGYMTYPSASQLLVMSEGKWGMIDNKGKVIIPAMYDELGRFNDEGHLPARLDGKWGVLDGAGKQVLQFIYDEAPWVMSGSERTYSVKLKGKRCIVDFDSKEVMPCIYDNFDAGHPYGTADDVWVVISNQKLGIYDRVRQKEVIPPTFDHIFPATDNDSLLMVNIGAVDTDPEIYSNEKYKGGKWGMMDRHGKIVIPVEYDLIAPFNREAGLLKAGKSLKKDKSGSVISAEWEYYTTDGAKVKGGEQRWNASYVGKMALAQKSVDIAASWVSANGPEGADATAFYIDKKGNYWLGTGSSGGVYVSSDEGRTWKERNAGIGPVHVQLMNNINDTMFVKVAGAGYEEPMEMRDNTIYEWEKVYYFNDRSNSWTRVDSARVSEVNYALVALADSNRTRMDSIYPMRAAHDNIDRYFVGYEFNQAYHMQNHLGIERVVKDSAVVFSKGFPKDVFWLRSGNLYETKKGAILIGKSGVFRYSTEPRIERLGEKGLIASDVTQVFRNEDGSYFARTGTSDIWHYDGKAWKKLIDAYMENLNASNSYSGYSTGWINAEPNGKIIFAMSGSLYEMDKTGSRQLLVKQQELKSKGVRMMPVSAVRDGADRNTVHGLALVMPLDGDPRSYSLYGTQFNFHRFTYNTSSKKMQLADTALASIEQWETHPVTFKDKKGNTWVCTDKSVLPAGNSSLKGIDSLSYLRPQTTALGNNGEIAIAQESGALCLYDPVKRSWMNLSTPHLGSIDKLGFDNDGNLYAACNYEFQYYCGGKGKVADPGFYRLVFTAVGPEWKLYPKGPNQRILSIAPHPKGLAIGTSGSGLYILEMNKGQASK